MILREVRRLAAPLAATPLHPQWLLRPQRRQLGRLVAGLATGRVLDVGCADRWIERELGDGARYVGADSLHTGQALYGARPHVYCDAAVLPFADRSFDAVLLLDVLEHLREPRRALGEIARVLTPGGRLVVDVPFLYPVHDAPHDYQRFTAHGLERELAAVGLQVERLAPNLGASETAGLVRCLALAGAALDLVHRPRAASLLLPLVGVAVPVTNVVAWLLGRLLPSWDAVTAGYRVVARRPGG